MDHWIIKQALFEQHRDQLLQEAARERLLRRARDYQIEKKFMPRREGGAVLKRRFAIGLAILVLAALWAVHIAAAAGLGGGGGRLLVM